MFMRMILGMMVVAGILGMSNAQAATPTVVINELMWMGTSKSSADEWIELRNLTDQPVDISGWKLTKKSNGQEADMATLPGGSIIEPNGFWLISNYPVGHASTSLIGPVQTVTTDVALSNSALHIKLYDAAGLPVDAADDGAGNPLAGHYQSSDKIFYSMERNADPGDGTLPTSWHTATRSQGFIAESLEQGTPGFKNSNGAPVAQAGPNQSGIVGTDINFDGSESFDSDGQPLSHQWEFGDGATSAEITPKHTYAAAGVFEVRLTVTDGTDSATDTLQVTITAPPAAAPSPPSLSNPSPGSLTSNQTSCRGLRLSEILPNPAGSDEAEFIELENTLVQAVPLTGCKVWSGERRVYTFTEGSVPSRGYFPLEKVVSRLNFTNTGGIVRLVDTDGTELDRVEYGTAPDGESWSRFAAAWGWTDIVTPAALNREPTAPLDSSEVDAPKNSTPASKQSSKALKPAKLISLRDVQEAASGDFVRVTGTITSPYEALGAKITYLEAGGTAVMLSVGAKVRVPPVGTRVQADGTVRTYQGRKRIMVTAITAVGREEAAALEISIGEITEDMVDRLIKIRGVIGDISGSRMLIDDNTGELTVYLKASTGIVKPKVKSGDRIAVVGILTTNTAGLRLVPRRQEDVAAERVLGATMVVKSPVVVARSNPNEGLWYWLAAGAGCLLLGAKPTWQWWKKRGEAAA